MGILAKAGDLAWNPAIILIFVGEASIAASHKVFS